MSNRLWKLKDGTRVKVTDMETSHIRNTVNMLEQQLNDMNLSEDEIDLALFDDDTNNSRRVRKATFNYNWIRAFERELKRRNGQENS